MSALLEVEDLRIRFAGEGGALTAVDGLGFSLAAGEALGLVGESGSGKSQTAFALMGLLPETATVQGVARLGGEDLLAMSRAEHARRRGARIALVFQDPMTALNPHLRIGLQLAEVLEVHRGATRTAATAEALRLLDAVQLPDAARLLSRYPHELSGGQRQRVLIAQALLCRPQVLIADEPTTALDVTVQAQILRLLAGLRRDFELALLMISHDLGVIAEVCSRVLVLYAGRPMEAGETAAVMQRPEHPYTRALLDARPDLRNDRRQLLRGIAGAAPDARRAPTGCVFAPRCIRADERCRRETPAYESAGSRSWACFKPL